MGQKEIDMAASNSLPSKDPLAGDKEEREASFFKQQAEAAATKKEEDRANMSTEELAKEADLQEHDDKKKSMLNKQMRSYSKTSLAKGKTGGRSSLKSKTKPPTTPPTT